MSERALSVAATLTVGASLVVTFRDAVTTSPTIGWVVVASGVGMILTTIASVAFPDATVLGKPLGGRELPRRTSLVLLALGTVSLLLAALGA
ncbi:hypothetical protein G9C85_08635 [Halorubellus sp. JP-L1]|uniref:hypothetical protein n=1 Tax=Halorubellus sp. JP-L1 TaxID=2715753 RepID=UPI00140A68D2|nr:hypothetical protein [Halorubellus sp. JP-L1]NHN41698.1 hypothetical protein [Halorubellus sp. JP-L1]